VSLRKKTWSKNCHGFMVNFCVLLGLGPTWERREKCNTSTRWLWWLVMCCLWFVDAGMNPMTLIVIVFWCLIWQDLDLGSAPLCCIRRYIICFSVSCNIIIYEQNYLASVHKRILRHSLHLPAIHFSCIIDRALVNYQNCV
jgi:hypothetical protein